MIGKLVSKEELNKLKDHKAEREKLLAQLRAEIQAIKPGECLKYESGSGSFALFGLISLLSGIEGVETITKDDCLYVYRD